MIRPHLFRQFRRCAPVVVLLGVLIGPGAGVAHGQTSIDPATEAKAQYELGITAYGLGDYERAIQAFSKAHKLDPAPILLYNIAQAYRKKGDAAQAIRHYKRYLEAAPAADDREQVEARIRELERGGEPAAEVKGEPGVTGAPPVPVGGVTPAEPAPPMPGGHGTGRLPPGGPVAQPPPDLVFATPGPPPVYRQPWFWGVVGAATLVLAASIVFLRPEDHWTCSAPDCNLPTRTVF
jgi:tetratricopeptide (TPR) repeat protein